MISIFRKKKILLEHDTSIHTHLDDLIVNELQVSLSVIIDSLEIKINDFNASFFFFIQIDNMKLTVRILEKLFMPDKRIASGGQTFFRGRLMHKTRFTEH